MAKSGEKNPLIKPELNCNKEKEEAIEDIVTGYRKLGYSEEKIEKIRADLLADFQKDSQFEVEKEELYGNQEKILENLKENCVKVEENVEYMGHKGKKVHINLPAVGEFEGFKFDYFVSDAYITKEDFEKKPELEKKSYSMNDVSELLKAMNGFMAALGCETDGNMEYESELRYWEINRWGCDAGDCLKAITGLDGWYWLSDKNVAGRNGSYAFWFCIEGYCNFDRNDDGVILANFFLRLSD